MHRVLYGDCRRDCAIILTRVVVVVVVVVASNDEGRMEAFGAVQN